MFQTNCLSLNFVKYDINFVTYLFEKVIFLFIINYPVLIIVYSLSGTTTKVANVIKEETGGDIFNVNCLVDYTGISGFLKAGYHQVAGIIPDIKDVPNIDEYDLIYVGGPVYWFERPNSQTSQKS